MVCSGAAHPRRLRWLLPALAALQLCGCSNVGALRGRDLSADGFSPALAREYLAYAESERELGRAEHAEVLALKGLAAAENKPPLPPAPISEKILISAHKQLLARVQSGAAQEVPDDVARAQLLYECWLAQVQQGEPAGKAACGFEFRAVMNEINLDFPLPSRPAKTMAGAP